MRRSGDIADDDGEGITFGAVRGIYVAHCDRRPDRRPEAAAGDLADRSAGGIDDLRALARRGTAVGADADPLALRSVGELAQHRHGTGEPAFGVPPFANRPGEPRLDRRRGFIDVMAVETQTGLEAQRVAGAEP